MLDDIKKPLVEFFVEGSPKGQPRPRVAVIAGRARMYNGKSACEWSGLVKSAAQEHCISFDPSTGDPVSIELEFAMPRPANHTGTGKNEGKLKPWAPHWHTNKPDIDNAVKLVLDQLHDIVYDSDQVVTSVSATKSYALEGCSPGCLVRIRPA